MVEIRNTEVQNPSTPIWEICGNLLVRCIEAEGNVIVKEYKEKKEKSFDISTDVEKIGDNAFFR
mgnify:CR=1 FL=1